MYERVSLAKVLCCGLKLCCHDIHRHHDGSDKAAKESGMYVVIASLVSQMHWGQGIRIVHHERE